MGLEFITQPQVFTQRLTALGGIEGYIPPFVSSFYTWTSTSPVTASAFPLPGSIGLLDIPGSYIVSVGGVLQSPTNYTINVPTRTLTFDFTVNADTPVVVTQIGTVGLSSIIDSLSAGQFVTPNLSAINGSITNLLVTNLTALSSVLQVTDIQLFELSGFNVQGNVGISGNVSVNGVLSAREIDLVHTPANDGVDPILDIGETTTDGFSGIRVRYEESTNRLLVQTVASSLTSNSVIIDRATGQVGISAIPNQALTVVGNISATGNLLAENLSKYFILSADLVPRAVSATVPFFDTSISLNLQENKNYKINYDLYFLNLSAGSLRYILSASNNLSGINCNYITTAAGGISAVTAGTPQMASTFVVNSGIAVLTPFTTTGNAVFHNSLVQAIIQTGPACTFNISISGNPSTNFITPKRGSSRVVQLME